MKFACSHRSFTHHRDSVCIGRRLSHQSPQQPSSSIDHHRLHTSFTLNYLGNLRPHIHTHTHTHRADCSNWISKAISKNYWIWTLIRIIDSSLCTTLRALQITLIDWLIDWYCAVSREIEEMGRDLLLHLQHSPDGSKWFSFVWTSKGIIWGHCMRIMKMFNNMSESFYMMPAKTSMLQASTDQQNYGNAVLNWRETMLKSILCQNCMI